MSFFKVIVAVFFLLPLMLYVSPFFFVKHQTPDDVRCHFCVQVKVLLTVTSEKMDHLINMYNIHIETNKWTVCCVMNFNFSGSQCNIYTASPRKRQLHHVPCFEMTSSDVLLSYCYAHFYHVGHELIPDQPKTYKLPEFYTVLYNVVGQPNFWLALVPTLI